MKLLVTGSSGFLGYHLKQEIAKHPEFQPLYPSRMECDLINYTSTRSYFLYNKPDVILHAAAVCAGIKGNMLRAADFLTDNTQMGINVYRAAKECNIKFVHTLGSVCSYPLIPSTIPFKETEIWQSFPEITNAPYGISKRVLMLLGSTHRQQYGILGTHLLPVNLMGTNDNFNLTTSHVIPALIRKFYEAKLNNNSYVECFGSGSASREFLNVRDASEAIIKAVLMNLDEELPINLGTGKEIIIKDLAELIAKLVGFKGEIVFNGSVSDGQPRRCLDVTRAKEILGWEAKIDLETGLKETIQWYAENRENILRNEKNDK